MLTFLLSLLRLLRRVIFHHHIFIVSHLSVLSYTIMLICAHTLFLTLL